MSKMRAVTKPEQREKQKKLKKAKRKRQLSVRKAWRAQKNLHVKKKHSQNKRKHCRRSRMN